MCYLVCLTTSKFLQGENLLQYFDAKSYRVKVGDAECTELRVENNLMTCKPPPDEPDYSDVQVFISHNTGVTVFMSLQSCIHMLQKSKN